MPMRVMLKVLVLVEIVAGPDSTLRNTGKLELAFGFMVKDPGYVFVAMTGKVMVWVA